MEDDKRNSNNTILPIHHSGVGKLYDYSFGTISIISLRVTITYRNHQTTKYNEYQQYLFNRIKTLYEDSVSGIGWKKIGDILNSEGLKSPMGRRLKSNNVQSIYKKGMRRKRRLNSEVEVKREVSIRHYENDEIEIIE